MSALRRTITRTSAFFYKETIVALGQPRLLLTVIVGPFLLLLLVAIGFTDNGKTFNTILVVPKRPNIPTSSATYSHFFFFSLHLVGVTTDEQQALQRLRNGEVDAVIVAPANPLADLADNQPADFRVYFDSLSPIERTQLNGLVYAHTRELNALVVSAMLSAIFQAAGVPQRTNSSVDEIRSQLLAGNSTGALGEIERLLIAVTILRLSGESLQGTASSAQASGQAQSLDQFQATLEQLAGNLSAGNGLTEQQLQELQQLQETAQQLPTGLNAVSRISPERLAAPTNYSLTNLAPSEANFIHYFAPAVVALLLQHIAITLAALSVVRERTRGTTELFEVAPVHLTEILIGKALSFAGIIGVLTAVLLVLLVFGLQIPFLGNLGWAVLVLALLIVISVSIGFCIGAISQTETQTVQFAMLVLLFSFFFGGLFVQPFALAPAIRGVAYIIPMQESGLLLRNIMLRGLFEPTWAIEALAAMTAVITPTAYLLMRRSFASR